MNAPLPFKLSEQPVPTRMPMVAESDHDQIDLFEYLGILLENKWLITAITALAVSAGIAYALFTKPIYQANLLIQVEDAKGGASSILGEASSLFDVKTPSAGEIEIIRSRMVVGQAVENTRLYIDAQPKRIPVIGDWLARHATELSEPGFLGMAGYVSGNEKIVVSHFEIPIRLQQDPFRIVASDHGTYVMTHSSLTDPLEGTVGRILTHDSSDGKIEILVDKLTARVGAEFAVSRSSRLAAVTSLQTRLQLTEKGRQSGVISATLKDDDPERLASVLNEIGKQYVRQNVERKAAEAQKTLKFLDEQLPVYKSEQEHAEEVYNRYRNQKGTVAFDEEAKLVLGQTVELETKLLEARQRRRELESRFTNSHPTIQTLDAQIEGWAREINRLNARVKGMPQIQQDALRMERDVRVNSEMYQSLLNNALQLNLVKEGKIGNVRLLDEAVVPEDPVSPRRSLAVGIAAMVGLMTGVLIALLRHSLSHGIRDPQEIEVKTGMAVYSAVPLSRDQQALDQCAADRKSGIHLLAVTSPSDPAIESLRSLRTALQFAMLESPNNRIMITGATPGVGKSFVSANFSAVLAAGGKRVLLIDADLRKGHINQQFGTARANGLSEVIVGTLSVDQAIRRQVLPGLDLLTTGVLPPNPAEMMMSDSLSLLLNQLSQAYDFVVVDTPPVLVAADTTAVAPHAGTVLLVARSEKTYVGELQESARRLMQAGKEVKGVLYNGMDLRRQRYGNKYGGYRYTSYNYKSAA